MSWNTGVIQNPTAGQVIADSGAFPTDGARAFGVFVASTVAAVFRFQWIDINGTSILREQYIPVPANGAVDFFPPAGKMEVDTVTGQRFRVIVNAAVTGSVSVSIHAD